MAAPTLDQRVEALELFMQHLVLVVECETHFTVEALGRWMDLARERMQATGSVAPGTQHALAVLQRRTLS
ncbi:hypothetical protein D3C72_2131480 [compost metagenome]